MIAKKLQLRVINSTVNYRVKFKLKAMRDHSASRGLWGRNYAVDQITSIQKKRKT